MSLKDVPVNHRGSELQAKAQSYFWKVFNSVGKLFTYVPFFGGNLLLLWVLVLTLLSPIFIIMDIVSGKKILSRGMLILQSDNNHKLNNYESVRITEFRQS